MPIDRSKALGAEFAPTEYSWVDKDVILYHLGIGAGDPPTSESELRYTYEGDLQVIPSFGTIPPFGTMMSLGTVDGIDIDLARILHGEQRIELHRPIPTTGSVRQRGKVVEIFDKGKGALIVMEIVSEDTATGDPMFTNRTSVFVKGEGGFDGPSGPGPKHRIPERDPDRVVVSPTLSQQALLYRMSSGDLNPLHVDPGFAMFAGYEKPILHGLCTYGICLKAVVDDVLESDPARVSSYDARFSGVVYPGESIETSIWETEGGYILEATVGDRGATVLSNAMVGVA